MITVHTDVYGVSFAFLVMFYYIHGREQEITIKTYLAIITEH
jgi:hypothetical protein